ncbi:hypothetical protein C9994_05865 [Marivirga lumbricoides]|uniref:Fibrobacter succinogenes major paralogous domain-containing protein n=1 Tax=Marivirga lumbricoides TaxID=1046115 RepID=A0A2T4DSH1_9BACT|nr:hypothetical protein C9994_05865 [Marivirga lumbricoides]
MAKYTYPTAYEGTFWSVLDGDYYVSTLGSDITGDGSPKKPFLSIKRAMELATDEEKIVIGPNEFLVNHESNGSATIGSKSPCRLATKNNINLLVGGIVTVDGVLTKLNDRILVWNQNSPAENGIYVVQNGEWLRADDFNTPSNMAKGAIIPVLEGATYENIIFQFTTKEDIVIDNTPLLFKVITSPDHNFLTNEAAEIAFVKKELPGYALPDSSLALWYNNDQATNESLGLFYPPSYLANLAPTGWRIPTKSEVDEVFSELNLPLNGKYTKGNTSEFENINLWGNYWFFADDRQVPESLYFNSSLSSVGWYIPTNGDNLRLPTRFVYKKNDDGRGISNFDVVSINLEGVEYETQRLSDGKIYLMQNYKGLLLDYERKLNLSKDKLLSWEIDTPTAHTHSIDEIENLDYISIKRDIRGYLPELNKRFIDTIEEDNVTPLARLYNSKAIESIVPSGWHLPTLAEWNNLLTAAGGGVFKDSTANDIKTVEVWRALSIGGSLGINIDTRGGASMVSSNAINDYWKQVGVNREDVINKTIVHSLFWPFYKSQAYYMIQRGTIPSRPSDRAGYVFLGNKGLYDQYNWYYSSLTPNIAEPEAYLKIRLIKDDSTDAGTVNFGGSKTYNTVKINDLVWLAEDFEEDTLPEESKSLVKENGELVWDNLNNKYQQINSASAELALTQTVDFSEANFQPRTLSGSLNITTIANPVLGSIIIPIKGGTDVTIDGSLIAAENIRGVFDTNKSINFLKITCYDKKNPAYFAEWVLEGSGTLASTTALEELEIQKTSTASVTDTVSDVADFDGATVIDSAGSSVSYNASTGVFTLAANKQYAVSINANYRATNNSARSTIDLRLVDSSDSLQSIWESYAYIREVNDKSSLSFIKKIVVGESPMEIKFMTRLSKSGSMSVEMISALVKITVVA